MNAWSVNNYQVHLAYASSAWRKTAQSSFFRRVVKNIWKMYLRKNGHKDGQQRDGQQKGQTGIWTDSNMDRQRYGRAAIWTGSVMNGQQYGRKNTWMNELHIWGRRDIQMNGQKDIRKDENMDGRTLSWKRDVSSKKAFNISLQKEIRLGVVAQSCALTWFA